MGPPQPGDPAPDFELPSAGGTFRLSSLRGHWTFLHFTASWCPYCDAEVDHLGEVAEAFGARGVRVVLVGVKEEPGHWSEYAAGHVAHSVVVLDDVDGAVARKYAPPRAQPSFEDRAQVVLDSTVIVDPQGTVRLFLFPDSKHFDPTFHAVRGELDRLIAGGQASASSPAAEELPGQRKAESVVAIEVNDSPRAAPGESGALTIALSIAPGYHVMSNHPSDPSYIPTRVHFEDAAGVTWEEPQYPSPMPFRLEGRSIDTFQGKTLVRVPFRVAPDAAPAPRRIEGTVRYQACTEGSCLFPVTRQVTATIEVLSRDTP
jgi:peroxiredoxin